MDKIEELLTRGVGQIYPSKETLEKVLRSGKKLTLYQGFDPTSPKLHIGHMVGIRKLKQFQDLGHRVIFLIGDFTGMIGDPTGKLSSRKQLTHDEVIRNAKLYKQQVGKLLRFEGENPVVIKYNSEWLGKMTALEFLHLSNNLTYSQVVERDMFQKRIQQKQDVFMGEFLYPFMQAYDSVAMDVDLEVGGEDQMFNMMMGRKLMRNILRKEKFVITTPLLTDSQGKKIGKTEGNVIAISLPPSDFYAQIMSLQDDVIIKCMLYLTDIPLLEIEAMEKRIAAGENPMNFKKQLAYRLTMMLNSQEGAKKAENDFANTVQKGELPKDILKIKVAQNVNIIDFMAVNNLVNSKSAAKRLVEQGGVEFNSEKVTDSKAKVQKGIIKIGKRLFVEVV
jgi:tyrosyl-tRNA synthetase